MAEPFPDLSESLDVTPHHAANGGAKTGSMYGLPEWQVEATLKILAACVAPHFKAFEKRLAELEARPALEDAGVWDRDRTFRPGQVTTHAGSMWICNQANSNTQPGTCSAWRLCVKRGADGKDARR